MGEEIITVVDGQKLKLTNLSKMIFPNAGLVKAEMIQYYKEIAPKMLPYISNRPLTLIRYPDGIEGKKFYSKNKPKWTPDWMPTASLPGDDNQYLLVHRTPHLIWISNLAAIELHPMQIRGPEFKFPDHFIFDLDPSPKFAFEDLKELGVSLRDFLVDKGYHPFIKTSGSKGLHIYVPIRPLYPHEEFYDSIKAMAERFVALHKDICTLRISKEKRLGKVLLDIYRNHRSNSCVAPYSLRAKPHAPISMPISWEELDEISHSQHFKLGEFDPNRPDAWQGFHDFAVELHDRRKKVVVSEALKNYDEKRDFEKTPEPMARVEVGNNDQFVVQLHNASNLHYDLRLEWNGVLLSWAIPKALPMKPEENRLAIQTEDHPMKYLDFEGKIPKNEYGGGQMWIADRGRYQMIKKEAKKLHFVLEGQFFKRTYKLINTKNRQWLLKLIGDEIQIPIYKPMLASSADELPEGDQYVYEVKWDGLRALIHYSQGKVKITSRSGSDLTSQFPELVHELSIDAEEVLLDGEIVVLNSQGVSDFSKVVSRLHSKQLSSKAEFVVFYAFDLLYLDGMDTTGLPLLRRKEWLSTIISKNKYLRVSEHFIDGQTLFSEGKKMGLEGIMVKDRNGRYFPGQRREEWLKVKYRSELEAFIIGYTEGSGDRQAYFGALHLGTEDGSNYIGKVGSGFNGDQLKDIMDRLKSLRKINKFIEQDIDEAAKTTWVEPQLRCRVRFASWTNSGTLREPVFMGLV